MTQALDLFDLHNRVALVTGGAGLLGGEFCHTLAQAGAQVVVADINGDLAANVAKNIQQLSGHAYSLKVDVRDISSVREMVQQSLEQYQRLDILVNCAAIDPKFDPQHDAQINSFEEYPLDSWEQAIKVNLTGVFLCCQAAVKPMLSQGQGVIINLSSIYGITAPDQRLYQYAGQPNQYKPVYYPVTKTGILGLTKYLAAYYAGKNIRVNALSPGGIFNEHDDDFVKAYSSRTILGRMAGKDDLNGALLFLASDASAYMTGANLVVDGGWSTW